MRISDALFWALFGWFCMNAVLGFVFQLFDWRPQIKQWVVGMVIAIIFAGALGIERLA